MFELSATATSSNHKFYFSKELLGLPHQLWLVKSVAKLSHLRRWLGESLVRTAVQPGNTAAYKPHGPPRHLIYACKDQGSGFQ